MSFKTMDPELVWKCIEGCENILAPEQTKLEAFYRQFVCPKCKGNCRKEYTTKHAFADPDTLIPRAMLRCTTCNHLFDPHSGIHVELGQDIATKGF